MPHVFAGRRKARFGVGAHETPFAIGPANARFGTEGSVLPYRAAERIDESRRIGGMNKLVPFAALHLLAGHAAEFSVFPVDEPNFSVNAGDPQQRWAAVGHGAEAFFTLAQRLLGVPALRDVFHMNDRAERAAVGGSQQRDPHMAPDNPSVAADVAPFALRRTGTAFP